MTRNFDQPTHVQSSQRGLQATSRNYDTFLEVGKEWLFVLTARRVFLDALFDKGGDKESERESFMKHMNTEGRLVGPVTVKKYITFDRRKLNY